MAKKPTKPTAARLTGDAKRAYEYLEFNIDEVPPIACPLLIAYCQQWECYQASLKEYKRCLKEENTKQTWTVYSQMSCSLKHVQALDKAIAAHLPKTKEQAEPEPQQESVIEKLLRQRQAN